MDKIGLENSAKYIEELSTPKGMTRVVDAIAEKAMRVAIKTSLFASSASFQHVVDREQLEDQCEIMLEMMTFGDTIIRIVDIFGSKVLKKVCADIVLSSDRFKLPLYNSNDAEHEQEVVPENEQKGGKEEQTSSNDIKPFKLFGD